MRGFGVLLAALLALFSVGCGSSDSSDAGAPPSPPPAPPPATITPPPPEPPLPPPPAPSPTGGKTDLRITVWATGQNKGTPQRWTLRCRPTGGTLPRRDRACRAVAAKGLQLVAPVPKNVACTAIYGGPQVAELQGTLGGQAVTATFKLTNGCEISRWRQAGALFGSVPGPGS